MITYQQVALSKLRPPTPRRHHSTTFIEADKRDIFDEDIYVPRIPNDKKLYKNKSYPPSSPDEDKYPSEVLEIDATMYSFERYPGHIFTIPSATRSESGQTGFSNQGEVNSSIRLATMQRPKITSFSGIPYFSKPSRYTEYQDQKKRYDSFQTPKWLTDYKPDINLLVGCGFFFTENNDLVRCYHCGIGLKDWTIEDDPLTQHVKYSSTCDFLNWRYGKPKVERTKAALTNESRSPPPSYTIRSPRYQTMKARLASFENFPSGNCIPHQQLAVAGLFFTGQGDLCRCFCCDGGLKDWSSGDDPIKEHARSFPNCSYINSLKGKQYVQSLQPRGLENEHICCRKDDIGGYYTSSQRSDRTGNITESMCVYIFCIY
ncbi:baculoviral IAP repeat-containing protein 3-like isoform X2 [Ruditapes philippinarum]|uniref:baculoviral IAP repeat-containing protein 3-like isoform X2 n=1 Tax=Ruditapes philippinarum TaxID=129788 RepID=UPI00295AFE9F|nr:baculoviral IAP repeat-containing protein 3-like isoform X2 [Ruditapes philippinarum]